MREITLNGIKYINADTINASEPFWVINQSYFIRTVTMYLVGRLESITSGELVLSSCSWIADTGRFHDAIKRGVFEEVEPFVNVVLVNRTAIIDATIFSHDLPTDQK